MLEADEQDTLELQPPRAGKRHVPVNLPQFHRFHWVSTHVATFSVNSSEESVLLIILSLDIESSNQLRHINIHTHL